MRVWTVQGHMVVADMPAAHAWVRGREEGFRDQCTKCRGLQMWHDSECTPKITNESGYRVRERGGNIK